MLEHIYVPIRFNFADSDRFFDIITRISEILKEDHYERDSFDYQNALEAEIKKLDKLHRIVVLQQTEGGAKYDLLKLYLVHGILDKDLLLELLQSEKYTWLIYNPGLQEEDPDHFRHVNDFYDSMVKLVISH